MVVMRTLLVAVFLLCPVHEGVLTSLVQSLSRWMDQTNDRDLPPNTVALYKVLFIAHNSNCPLSAIECSCTVFP